MLCVHGLNIVLVLMVARRMDRHVPSTWQVRDKKRKVLHYILFAPLPAVIAAQLPQKKKAAFVLILLLGCA
jgi:hypothetical protein